MTGRIHKNIVKELERKNQHAHKDGFKKDDNIHGRKQVQAGRMTNTKNK